MQGNLFDIQKFCPHDGPGIRTTVFFKGCNNICPWCHNPESLSGKQQIKYMPDKCIGDGACLRVCPTGAHTLQNSMHGYSPAQCTACGKCADVCYAGAMVLCGYQRTAEEVLDEVLSDEVFYRTSGGGVTFSGGEPLLQSEFLARCLQLCHEHGIHTAVETALNVPSAALESILPHTDLFLCDIKHCDNAALRSVCGIDGARMRNNLARISAYGTPFWVRTPVAVGYNADETTIAGIAAQANLPGLTRYELLPLHNYAANKYMALGMAADTRFTVPTADTMTVLAHTAARTLPCVVYDGKEFAHGAK